MSDCFLFMLHLSKMVSTLKQPLLSHLLLLNGFFVLMENPFVAVAYVYENMCVGEQKYHHPHLPLGKHIFLSFHLCFKELDVENISVREERIHFFKKYILHIEAYSVGFLAKPKVLFTKWLTFSQ